MMGQNILLDTPEEAKASRKCQGGSIKVEIERGVSCDHWQLDIKLLYNCSN